MKRKFLLAILQIITYLGGSHITADAQSSSNFVRHEQGSRNIIVFVHGVLGDSKTTWDNNGIFWPNIIKDDAAFTGSDIYVYGFPTELWGALSIDELAENMRLRLNADGIDEYEHIAFLAHSMGGLVTRSYLLKNRDLARKTSLLYFLSTPTTGSQIAKLASLISSNPQFSKMKPMNADDFLADVLRQWLSADLNIPAYCAYEKRPTYGVMIVEMQSASALCTKALDPIDASHITIAKPGSNSADAYLAFKGAFRKEMSAARPKEALVKQFTVVLNALHATQMARSEFLFPQMEDYIAAPTENKWYEIKQTAQKISADIQDAANAAIAFDSQLYEIGNEIIVVSNGTRDVVDRSFNQPFRIARREWNGKAFVLREIQRFENRPTSAQMREWSDTIRSRYVRLEAELMRLLEIIRTKA